MGDSSVVQIRTNRERSEKTDAAPSRGEVRADQAAVEGRAEGGDVRRTPAAVNIVAVRPEAFWIGSAKKRAERHPDDACRFRQIAFIERGDRGRRARVVSGCRHWDLQKGHAAKST